MFARLASCALLLLAAPLGTRAWGPSPPSSAPSPCPNRAWDQCGGRAFAGATCCAADATCRREDEWYAQCVPSPRDADAAGCASTYARCGGRGWRGATRCCEADTSCRRQDAWYSQCVPREGSSEKETLETPKPARACVFDFDETIKLGGGGASDAGPVRVARDAREVIRRCVREGFAIGVASASCESAFQKDFLNARVDSDVFSTRFLDSDAYQSCQPVKTPALRRVLEHHGVEARCAVFFDDKPLNEKYAREVGMGFFALVDDRVGVAEADFRRAAAKLRETCDADEGGRG